jgi:hypothetical protein
MKSKGGNMEKVKGGKADGMKCKDIAKMHKVPLSKIMSEFKLGRKVESEHTDDATARDEIVRDHLYDNPAYYSEGRDKGIFDELKKSIPEEAKKEVDKFLMEYKGEFDDDDLHKLADGLKISPHLVESYVYSIARDHLNMKKSDNVVDESKTGKRLRRKKDSTGKCKYIAKSF